MSEPNPTTSKEVPEGIERLEPLVEREYQDGRVVDLTFGMVPEPGGNFIRVGDLPAITKPLEEKAAKQKKHAEEIAEERNRAEEEAERLATHNRDLLREIAGDQLPPRCERCKGSGSVLWLHAGEREVRKEGRFVCPDCNGSGERGERKLVEACERVEGERESARTGEDEFKAEAVRLRAALQKIADGQYQDIIGIAGDLTVADQMQAEARAALTQPNTTAHRPLEVEEDEEICPQCLCDKAADASVCKDCARQDAGEEEDATTTTPDLKNWLKNPANVEDLMGAAELASSSSILDPEHLRPMVVAVAEHFLDATSTLQHPHQEPVGVEEAPEIVKKLTALSVATAQDADLQQKIGHPLAAAALRDQAATLKDAARLLTQPQQVSSTYTIYVCPECGRHLEGRTDKCVSGHKNVHAVPLQVAAVGQVSSSDGVGEQAPLAWLQEQERVSRENGWLTRAQVLKELREQFGA